MVACRCRFLLRVLRRYLSHLPRHSFSLRAQSSFPTLLTRALPWAVFTLLLVAMLCVPRSAILFLAMAFLCCLAPVDQLARGHGEKSLINVARYGALAVVLAIVGCAALLSLPFSKPRFLLSPKGR